MITSERWKQEKLGNVIDTQKGFAFKSAWYCDDGRPIVKVSDFTQDSIDASALTKIPDEIAEKYLRYELREGDVVIQTVGSWPSNPASVVGKCIRVPRSAHNALLNQNAVRLSPKSEANNRYLYHVLKAPQFSNYIVGTAQGAASQAAITLEAIRAYDLPIPSLPTQRKIASILSTYDDLIENNLRRIKILEEMAQAIYREWFVKFRFPGHEKVQMVDSPLGKIPEGWELANLSHLVDTQYGYTESATVEKVGPKFLRGTDINKTFFVDWSNVPHCPIPEDKLSKYQLSIGDIIVIRMADPGKVGIVEKEIDAVFASYLVRLKIISNFLSPYFLFYFLTSDRYQGYITGASTGTTRKSASAGVIIGIDLAIPPLYIRKQFENQVIAIRQFLNKLLEKNTNLRRTRDLLLPKLISGELDVSDFDIKTGGHVQ